MIIVNQMCGEFKFWRGVAEDLSRAYGYKIAGTICIRPILPYIRLAGFKIDRIEKTNLGDRFFCTDKKTGQKGQASPAGNASRVKRLLRRQPTRRRNTNCNCSNTPSNTPKLRNARPPLCTT